ncbi:signal peptidase I [Pengzhenrongella phosphoraccumulans]|uniref:signal peptidase I n=1 Tax=Pengzhenrongella phosphoraccumulans TaxID=3114394 RepID=UPI00388E3861
MHTPLIAQPERRAAPSAARSGRRRPTSLRGRIAYGALWSIVGLCLVAYSGSLLVPLWYQLHHQRLLIVSSGSMSPYFDAGDAVVMRQINDPSELRVGQVASFWPPGSNTLVTHRITALKMLPLLEQDEATGRMVPKLDADSQPILRPYILTKGDANATPDPDATPLTRVRGVVLTVHPQWGAILDWANSPSGRFTLLTPPLAVLAGMEIAAVVALRRAKAVKPAAATGAVAKVVVHDGLLG